MLLRIAITLCLALSIRALGQSAAPALLQQTEPQVAFHCAQDGDIDPMRRAMVEAVATQFIHTVLSGDPGAAWDSMTDAAQRTNSRQLFVNAAVAGPIAAQPRNLTLQHTFLIHVVGTPSPGARVTCGADPSDPMQSFQMSVAPALEQGYTLFLADARQNALAFVVWLVRDRTGWKVNGFAANASTLAGRNAQQLWQLGRSEHEQAHDFNATLLYAAVLQIAQRGPDFSLGFFPQVAGELAVIPKPKQISGNPPFTFEDHGRSFRVRDIGPTDVGGRLYLGLAQEIEPWKSPKFPERRNRELISLIKREFPEYATVFAGILVQALEQGTGRTAVTLEEQPSRP
jgi:hypothetical protein